jgi:hypothetical protein
MKAEKATNIALENDELIDSLELNRYERSHKSINRVCKIPNTLSNSVISLLPI